MNITTIISIWVVLGLLVIISIYRQVRSYIEMRNMLKKIETNYEVIASRLDKTIRSIEGKPEDEHLINREINSAWMYDLPNEKISLPSWNRYVIIRIGEVAREHVKQYGPLPHVHSLRGLSQTWEEEDEECVLVS